MGNSFAWLKTLPRPLASGARSSRGPVAPDGNRLEIAPSPRLLHLQGLSCRHYGSSLTDQGEEYARLCVYLDLAFASPPQAPKLSSIAVG